VQFVEVLRNNISMKIATYNVNGIGSRLPVLLQWLEKSKPDIACLQELKAPQDRFPEEELLNAGYHAQWMGQKSWNGVAILSKEKSKVIRTALPGDDTDEASRFLEVEYPGMTVVCIYVPNGNPTPGPKFDYKLNWLQRFAAHTEMLITSGKKVIITGDFNIIPTPADVYKPVKYEKDALFVPEVRAVFQEILQQGWMDALRKVHPDTKIYTFYDYFRKAYERDAGMRIDHFLLTSELAERLTSGGVDKEVRGWEKTSDHVPTWITLK